MLFVIVGGLVLDASVARAARTRHEVVRELALVREASAVLRSAPAESTWFANLRFLAPLEGHSTEPRLAAIRRLAASRLPAAAFALREVIVDREFSHRQEAIRALARVPHPIVLDALVELLDDPDPAIRQAAARALGSVGLNTVERDVAIAPAVDRLKSVLKFDDAREVRISALDSLVVIATTESLVTAFEMAIHDPDAMVQCSVLGLSARLAEFYRSLKVMVVARALVPMGLDPATDSLSMGVIPRALSRRRTRMIISSESQCADPPLEALRRLAEVRAPKYFRLVLESASSEDPGLRAQAIEGLANYSKPEVLPAIQLALDDPTRGVRRAAIEALAELDSEEAARVLAQALSNSSREGHLGEDDRRQIAASLPGSWGAESLVQSLSGGAVQVRRAAERTLVEREARIDGSGDVAGTMPGKPEGDAAAWQREQLEAEVALGEALGSGDERMRARAALVLARFDSRSSFDQLLARLDSESTLAREAAALALGLRGDPAARVALEAAVRSKDEAFALASIRALQDLGEVESLPRLREIAAGDPSPPVGEALANAITILQSGL